MVENKQREEVSLIGRILSLEALLLLMGTASVIYGVTKGEVLNIAVGGGIVLLILLLMHRRKNG